MENVFGKKELKKIYMEAFADLIKFDDMNFKTWPLNVGISKMNKKQLADHIRVMWAEREKRMA